MRLDQFWHFCNFGNTAAHHSCVREMLWEFLFLQFRQHSSSSTALLCDRNAAWFFHVSEIYLPCCKSFFLILLTQLNFMSNDFYICEGYKTDLFEVLFPALVKSEYWKKILHKVKSWAWDVSPCNTRRSGQLSRNLLYAGGHIWEKQDKKLYDCRPYWLTFMPYFFAIPPKLL